MDMTRERLAALAEAYGGDLTRWPAVERDAAAKMLDAEGDFARRTLTAARGLDAVLDAWRPLAVGAELAEAVRRAAPRARRRPAWSGWLWQAGLGAGLAGAGAAGVLVGALAWTGAGVEADVITAVMSGDEAGLYGGET